MATSGRAAERARFAGAAWIKSAEHWKIIRERKQTIEIAGGVARATLRIGNRLRQPTRVTCVQFPLVNLARDRCDWGVSQSQESRCRKVQPGSYATRID